MDWFFTQNTCDRCGGSLSGGRIMSMLNTDCLCLACKEKEPNEGVFPKVRLSFCVIRFLSIIFFFLSQEFFSLRTDAPRAFGRRRSSAL